MTPVMERLSVVLLQDMLRALHQKPAKVKAELLLQIAGLLASSSLPSTIACLTDHERSWLALAAHLEAWPTTIDRQRFCPGIVIPWDNERHDGWSPRTMSALDLFTPNRGPLEPGLASRLRALLPCPWADRDHTPQPHQIPPDGIPLVWDPALVDERLVTLARNDRLLTKKSQVETKILNQVAKACGLPLPFGRDLVEQSMHRLLSSHHLKPDLGRLIVGAAEVTDEVAFQGFWGSDRFDNLDFLALTRTYQDLPLAPTKRRQLLCQSLATLPVGSWIRFDDLVTHLAVRHHPLRCYARQEDCVGHIGRRSPYSEVHRLPPSVMPWIDRAWLVHTVGQTLLAWGAVEVALGEPPLLAADLANVRCYPQNPGWNDDTFPLPSMLSSADAITSFRLTPRGAWLLGFGPTPVDLTTEAGRWRLQADGTLVSLASKAPAKERLFAETIATRQDERTWRVTRASLMEALTKGTTEANVRQGLKNLSGIDLPGTMTALVDEAVRRSTSLSVGSPLVVIVCGDSHVYDLLRHDRKTRDLVQDLGQQRVGITPDQLPDLRKAAKALGWHLP